MSDRRYLAVQRHHKGSRVDKFVRGRIKRGDTEGQGHVMDILRECNADELRCLCKFHGMSTSGTKARLIRILVQEIY